MTVIKGWFIIEDGSIIEYRTTAKALALIMEISRYSETVSDMSYARRVAWDSMSPKKRIEEMAYSQYGDAAILQNPTPDELSEVIFNQLRAEFERGIYRD